MLDILSTGPIPTSEAHPGSRDQSPHRGTSSIGTDSYGLRTTRTPLGFDTSRIAPSRQDRQPGQIGLGTSRDIGTSPSTKPDNTPGLIGAAPAEGRQNRQPGQIGSTLPSGEPKRIEALPAIESQRPSRRIDLSATPVNPFSPGKTIPLPYAIDTSITAGPGKTVTVTLPEAQLEAAAPVDSLGGEISLITTTLPPQPNWKVMASSPTYGREDEVAQATEQLGAALKRGGYEKDSVFIQGHNSPTTSDLHKKIAQAVKTHGLPGDIPTYYFTMEDRRQWVPKVAAEAGVDEETVASILAEDTCGGGREAALAIAQGFYHGTGQETTYVMFDDDLLFPESLHYFPDNDAPPNSIMAVNTAMYPLDTFPHIDNGPIGPFIEIPGMTLEQIRIRYGNDPTAARWFGSFGDQLGAETWEVQADEIHDQAERNGMASYQIRPLGKIINEGEVPVVQGGKIDKMDRRTGWVGRHVLRNDYAPEFADLRAIPHGNQYGFFGVQNASPNFDMASAAWRIGKRTGRYVVNILDNMSLLPPGPIPIYRRDQHPPRNDNEGQQHHQKYIEQQTGEILLLGTGINFTAVHNRSIQGRRARITDGSVASKVGDLIARAEASLLNYRGEYPIMDYGGIDDYVTPDDWAREAYRDLLVQAEICEAKIKEHRQRSGPTSDDLVAQYTSDLLTISRRLGMEHFYEKSHLEVRTVDDRLPCSAWEEKAFDDWKKELDEVTRVQLRHHNVALHAKHRVWDAIGRMLKRGDKLPITRVINREPRALSYPGSPTKVAV
jgi:hypothetical protein